jgi:hypothetical protein
MLASKISASLLIILPLSAAFKPLQTLLNAFLAESTARLTSAYEAATASPMIS